MTNSASSPRSLNEFETIVKYFAPLSAGAPGAFGLRDDVATLRVPEGRELVAKVDAIVEGVHFFREDPASLVAKKALRVNLSDLAAKGAAPTGYLLSISLAPWADENWIARFADGLGEDQKLFGVVLLGGDTTSTPGALTISVTLLGSIVAGKAIRRGGARAGDLVFVTGTIGDAGAGLAVMKGEGGKLSPADGAVLTARYQLPEPRLALGNRLVGLATASLDVSDGLIADLGHIAEVSKVRIVVDARRVPLSSALVSLWGTGIDAVVRAVTSGDDYEIAFTAPPASRAELAVCAKEIGVPITQVGVVEEGAGTILLEMGKPVPIIRPGFVHF